ncbi:hypothetical protein BATDEDRAFT_92431 [Batrachochytrium dendrobatidis JAM81]|uniref:Uncharacterized protein n=1 Tax=Batrachochytrium dendrobatidis (strain JAM81 / FGSC 10211) TaxID=684364 RepID=F4PD93_BATDJ|nr:uncharacterized protein BATDEDRAFT_92431 [Batrachochytrium dendrobatidis JAM81]EGF76751.1 hypothetical protein BATDEDRAFT_92431 [Batrachochytrium dendrobatidis JAM81]|eukprot:XP_006682708.1 hypothetical protein BATDEDRAFT_92431 [Batrachochytrium dendrobatidis JAM81]
MTHRGFSTDTDLINSNSKSQPSLFTTPAYSSHHTGPTAMSSHSFYGQSVWPSSTTQHYPHTTIEDRSHSLHPEHRDFQMDSSHVSSNSTSIAPIHRRSLHKSPIQHGQNAIHYIDSDHHRTKKYRQFQNPTLFSSSAPSSAIKFRALQPDPHHSKPDISLDTPSVSHLSKNTLSANESSIRHSDASKNTDPSNTLSAISNVNQTNTPLVDKHPVLETHTTDELKELDQPSKSPDILRRSMRLQTRDTSLSNRSSYADASDSDSSIIISEEEKLQREIMAQSKLSGHSSPSTSELNLSPKPALVTKKTKHSNQDGIENGSVVSTRSSPSRAHLTRSPSNSNAIKSTHGFKKLGLVSHGNDTKINNKREFKQGDAFTLTNSSASAITTESHRSKRAVQARASSSAKHSKPVFQYTLQGGASDETTPSTQSDRNGAILEHTKKVQTVSAPIIQRGSASRSDKSVAFYNDKSLSFRSLGMWVKHGDVVNTFDKHLSAYTFSHGFHLGDLGWIACKSTQLETSMWPCIVLRKYRVGKSKTFESITKKDSRNANNRQDAQQNHFIDYRNSHGRSLETLHPSAYNYSSSLHFNSNELDSSTHSIRPTETSPNPCKTRPNSASAIDNHFFKEFHHSIDQQKNGHTLDSLTEKSRSRSKSLVIQGNVGVKNMQSTHATSSVLNDGRFKNPQAELTVDCHDLHARSNRLMDDGSFIGSPSRLLPHTTPHRKLNSVQSTNNLSFLEQFKLFRKPGGNRFKYLVRVFPIKHLALSKQNGAHIDKSVSSPELSTMSDVMVNDDQLLPYLMYEKGVSSNILSNSAVVSAIQLASSWAVPGVSEDSFEMEKETDDEEDAADQDIIEQYNQSRSYDNTDRIDKQRRKNAVLVEHIAAPPSSSRSFCSRMNIKLPRSWTTTPTMIHAHSEPDTLHDLNPYSHLQDHDSLPRLHHPSSHDTSPNTMVLGESLSQKTGRLRLAPPVRRGDYHHAYHPYNTSHTPVERQRNRHYFQPTVSSSTKTSHVQPLTPTVHSTLPKHAFGHWVSPTYNKRSLAYVAQDLDSRHTQLDYNSSRHHPLPTVRNDPLRPSSGDGDSISGVQELFIRSGLSGHNCKEKLMRPVPVTRMITRFRLGAEYIHVGDVVRLALPTSKQSRSKTHYTNYFGTGGTSTHKSTYSTSERFLVVHRIISIEEERPTRGEYVNMGLDRAYNDVCGPIHSDGTVQRNRIRRTLELEMNECRKILESRELYVHGPFWRSAADGLGMDLIDPVRQDNLSNVKLCGLLYTIEPEQTEATELDKVRTCWNEADGLACSSSHGMNSELEKREWRCSQVVVTVDKNEVAGRFHWQFGSSECVYRPIPVVEKARW